jgi:peptidoglycan/xylan/chitin deacetylase (PgdA/CDA1 family)
MSVKVLQVIAGPFLFFAVPSPAPPPRSRYTTFIALSLIFFSSPFCLAGDNPDAVISGTASAVEKTFGSQTILTTLWTPQELLGKPEDKTGVERGYRRWPLQEIPANIHAPLTKEFQGSLRCVTPRYSQKVIALTFDLCESTNRKSGYDADIINYLRGHQVKATFFAGGMWMVSHPEKILQLMADPLFEIGNHSWSHANFRTIDSSRMQAQILRTQVQYESFWETLWQRTLSAGIDPSEMNKVPESLCLFRFPYGACTPLALDMLNRFGLMAIQWDVVSGDPSPNRSAQMIADAILQKSHPGSIVICHANGRGHETSRALPIFIPRLQEMGFDFVTVSELLTHGPAVAVKECFELVPGDNLHYDKASAGKVK